MNNLDTLKSPAKNPFDAVFGTMSAAQEQYSKQCNSLRNETAKLATQALNSKEYAISNLSLSFKRTLAGQEQLCMNPRFTDARLSEMARGLSEKFGSITNAPGHSLLLLDTVRPGTLAKLFAARYQNGAMNSFQPSELQVGDTIVVGHLPNSSLLNEILGAHHFIRITYPNGERYDAMIAS